jgi:hypothetical protein
MTRHSSTPATCVYGQYQLLHDAPGDPGEIKKYVWTSFSDYDNDKAIRRLNRLASRHEGVVGCARSDIGDAASFFIILDEGVDMKVVDHLMAAFEQTLLDEADGIVTVGSPMPEYYGLVYDEHI